MHVTATTNTIRRVRCGFPRNDQPRSASRQLPAERCYPHRDKDYYPVAWTDGDNFVDADGKTYNKKEIGITSYNITGIKYVPVKVSSSDFADFCKQYTVTKNGETLQAVTANSI